MSKRDAFKLFWPSHISSWRIKRPGFLVGWHTNLTTMCVAAIMSDIEVIIIIRKREKRVLF